MIRTIRETKKFELLQSFNGIGTSFYNKDTGEQSLFDCERIENEIVYLIGCSDDEFNHHAKKEIETYLIN